MARAGKIANGFFIAWGLVCSAMLGLGLWMLSSGLRFRDGYQQAEAWVVNVNPQAGRRPKPEWRLRYAIDGVSYEIPAPPQDRHAKNPYYEGERRPVWFPKGNPQAAQTEGDRGHLIAGLVFTAAGVLFSLVGALAAVAEFRPNRFIRFGD